MAPTNVETVRQTFLLHIESNLDRLGLLSPTHGQRSQQQSGQITLQSVLIKPKFLKANTSCRNNENCNTGVYGVGGLELVKPAREPASSRPKPCAFRKNAPEILPVRHSLLGLGKRKQTVVRDQLSPQEPPGSRLWFSRPMVQYAPG